MCYDYLDKNVRNISNSKHNFAISNRKCTQVFTYITRYFCQIVKKVEFSRQNFFRKLLKYLI